MSKILIGVGAALLLSLATVVPAEAKGGGHSSGSRRTSRSYYSRSYRNYRGGHRYDYRGDRGYFYRYWNFFDFPFFGHR
jgi:hypothetical protein